MLQRLRVAAVKRSRWRLGSHKPRLRQKKCAFGDSLQAIEGAGLAFRIFPQSRFQRLSTSLAILLSLAVLVVAFGNVVQDMIIAR
jgi:hypothetical protein